MLSEECRKQRHAGVREWKELTHGSSWFLVRKTRTLIIVIVLGLNSTISNYVITLYRLFIRAAGMDFLKSPVPRLGLDYLCTGVTGVWLDTERLWGSGTKPEVASFSVTPSPGPLTGGGWWRWTSARFLHAPGCCISSSDTLKLFLSQLRHWIEACAALVGGTCV